MVWSASCRLDQGLDKSRFRPVMTPRYLPDAGDRMQAIPGTAGNRRLSAPSIEKSRRRSQPRWSLPSRRRQRYADLEEGAVPVTVDRRAAHENGQPTAWHGYPSQGPVGATAALDPDRIVATVGNREISGCVVSICLHAIRGQRPAGAALLVANRDGELNAAKSRPSGRDRAAQSHSLRGDVIAPFIKEITGDDHMSDRVGVAVFDRHLAV